MSQVAAAVALGLSVPTLVKRCRALGFDPSALTDDQAARVKAIPKHIKKVPSLLTIAKSIGPEERHDRALRAIAKELFGATANLTTEQRAATLKAYQSKLRADATPASP
jgi:hypothetical protein